MIDSSLLGARTICSVQKGQEIRLNEISWQINIVNFSFE